jgi:hypothetical protein
MILIISVEEHKLPGFFWYNLTPTFYVLNIHFPLSDRNEASHLYKPTSICKFKLISFKIRDGLLFLTEHNVNGEFKSDTLLLNFCNKKKNIVKLNCVIALTNKNLSSQKLR